MLCSFGKTCLIMSKLFNGSNFPIDSQGLERLLIKVKEFLEITVISPD